MRVGENFCPGVLHAVPAKDGLLIRIRIPGGLIDADQLSTVADLSSGFADGTIEITSRANLQLRAIRNEDLRHIVEGISSAGLLPSQQHDRVRNIVTSAIAGLDPDEVIDPRPLVHELDRRLQAEIVFASLHPKFSFAIYGGSRRFSNSSSDISLEAVIFNATPYFFLSIGGICSGFAVKRENAVECMLAAARMCIGLAKKSNLPVRGKIVAAIPGAMESIVDALSNILTLSPLLPPSHLMEEALVGLHPTTQPDRVSIVPSVPLGRLTAEQAHYLADTANEWHGDLRLAEWRGVVLGSIPKSAAENIIERLHSMGLACDGRDGFRGIAACAGSTGCDASLADVRGDSALLAQRLSGNGSPLGWTVNFSGCEKQCGRRHGATAELVAGPSGYNLNVVGRLAASNCSRAFAIDAVVALHDNLLSKGAIR